MFVAVRLLCSAPWDAFPDIKENNIFVRVSLCLLLCGCYVLLLGVRLAYMEERS